MSERKSSRTKKVVNYASYGNDGSDDDFATPTPPPPAKKAKLSTKDSKNRKSQNNENDEKKSKSRAPVEERLFDKELQLALELSISETQLPAPLGTSTQIMENEAKEEGSKTQVPQMPDLDFIKEFGSVEEDNKKQAVSQMPDLDAIEELGSVDIDNNNTKPRAKRKAAATANNKRKMMSDDDDDDDEGDVFKQKKSVIDDDDEDFKVEDALEDKENEDDDEDDDFDLEEDEDSDYEIEKPKAAKNKKGKSSSKDIQKRGKVNTKLKPKELPTGKNTSKGKKTPGNKFVGPASSVTSTSLASARIPSTVSRTPLAVSRSSLSSPGVAPKWKPPALSKPGASPTSTTCNIGMISPTGLRLGLSRNIRVSKPLHSKIKTQQ